MPAQVMLLGSYATTKKRSVALPSTRLRFTLQSIRSTVFEGGCTSTLIVAMTCYMIIRVIVTVGWLWLIT